MISSHCLMMKSPSTVDASSTSPIDERSQKNNYSSISVVREIAHRTVLPYVVACSQHHSPGNNTLSLLRGTLPVNRFCILQ